MVSKLDSAKVLSEGQVTIPKNIRDRLNISEGDQLILIYDNEKIVMMNPAIYAMKMMQDVMDEEAKINNITELDVVKMVKEVRE